jgi:hypothetical protein
MPNAGDIIYATDVTRARSKRFWDQASSTLGASQSVQPVPGISISFTTETANAELALVWFMHADPSPASGTIATAMSARPLVTGPGGYSQQPTAFAISAQAAAGPADASTPGNSGLLTLGAAGTYTVTLLATTGITQTINIYSSVLLDLQEQFT